MLQWPENREQTVQTILDKYPPESNDCALAAQEVLPHATELDEHAHAILIEPPSGGIHPSKRMKGPYLVPREGTRARYWTHHVTVQVEAYYLDALTGAPGHQRLTYLETFFQFADVLLLAPVEDHQWNEL